MTPTGPAWPASGLHTRRQVIVVLVRATLSVSALVAAYFLIPTRSDSPMAIEVRIPTILRTYTDGAKAVTGEGTSLAELIDNLEAAHPGLRDRLLDGADLRRFVNVYVNDEDVRFTGGLATELSDGDQVVVLPAVAGGAGR